MGACLTQHLEPEAPEGLVQSAQTLDSTPGPCGAWPVRDPDSVRSRTQAPGDADLARLLQRVEDGGGLTVDCHVEIAQVRATVGGDRVSAESQNQPGAADFHFESCTFLVGKQVLVGRIPECGLAPLSFPVNGGRVGCGYPGSGGEPCKRTCDGV